MSLHRWSYCIEFTHTQVKWNWGNRNNIRGLYQYPSCDIIIQFSKILLLVEIGQRIHRISLYDFLQLHEDLLQEGRPLPGPETGLLSNTQKWIVREDTCADKARDYWERAPGWRAVGWGNPGEQLCRVARSLEFYGDGISFQIVFKQSFWLRVLPGEQVHALFSQDGCIQKDSERWLDTWCHFFTFPELNLLMVAY